MLIHTDEKPFVCEMCDQSFRQKQLLKRHINHYHEPNYQPPEPKAKTNQCPHCDRSFCHKGNLMRHMAVHDKDGNSSTSRIIKRLKLETDDEEYKIEALEELEEDDEMETVVLQETDDANYVFLEVADEEVDEANIEYATVEEGDVESEGYILNGMN